MPRTTEQEKLPPQHQERQPGIESEMIPRPRQEGEIYRPGGKLKDKVAVITGGDSGIGRAIALAFAKEGADSVIVYLEEHSDAEETRTGVEREERRCLLIDGDVADVRFCNYAVERAADEFGKIDVLINNAAVQYPQESIDLITPEQLERTFRVNIFSYFYMAKAAVKHLKEGSSIINTTSITAYKGNPRLLDYSSTKGAIVAFTRSLSLQLVDRGIRVNAVAPGPIWTPLIPSSFAAEHVETFGSDVPLKRVGQPEEVAPSYVFLASDDASYITGQVLHPNGGVVVNG